MTSVATTRPRPSAVLHSVWQTTPCSAPASCVRTCVLLVRREDVDDTVDRLRGVLGVQRREDEVTGLGGGQRDRDRLEVAHLADEDDVRVLPQHVLEGLREGVRVLADLALVDEARLVPVQELDGVLDGHDVVAPGPVGQVDERGEGRRLARAGRPGHEDHPARQAGEVAHRRRDPEVLQTLDLVRDQPERRADRLPLPVDVDPEAGRARAARRRSRARAPPRSAPAASG